MWHLTCDTLELKPNTWHLTYDLWHIVVVGGGGVSILSKFQLPSSFGLSVVMFWRFGGERSVNQSMHITPHNHISKSPKEEEKILYVFFLYRCYYPHTARDSVSPVCGIFLVYFQIRGPSEKEVVSRCDWGVKVYCQQGLGYLSFYIYI